MKDEAELNLIFKKSLKLGEKIPDPNGSVAKIATQRPFDGFGALNGRAVYWEGKYIKGLGVFDLQKIYDHQILNLRLYKENVDNCYSWVVLGVKAGHGDNRLYIFDNLEDLNQRRDSKNNIFKKELETLPYYPVFKGLVDLSDLTKIIH